MGRGEIERMKGTQEKSLFLGEGSFDKGGTIRDLVDGTELGAEESVTSGRMSTVGAYQHAAGCRGSIVEVGRHRLGLVLEGDARQSLSIADVKFSRE